MGDNSNIEWTDATWNPIVGCSIVSPGCRECYAMKFAARMLDGNPKSPHYAGTTQQSKAGPVWTGKVVLAPEHIVTAPLRWKKPRRIFANSMGDLFHEDCPDEWILDALTVMAIARQHTFQVLTKRAERMRHFMSNPDLLQEIMVNWWSFDDGIRGVEAWPLPNVWLGVSVEDQKRADERIPDLLHTPAAVRFISAEPLLGDIDLADHLALDTPLMGGIALHWVIAGGESGPNARPMHPDWARSLRDQCATAGVPFFFKQWGEWHPSDAHDPDCHKACDRTPDAVSRDGRRELRPIEAGRLIGNAVSTEWVGMCRIGKRQAGRLLDGREHNDMPEVRQ